MTLYLLTTEHCDETTVHGLFSTEGLAEHAKRCLPPPMQYSRFNIRPLKVDSQMDEIWLGWKPYIVHVRAEGEPEVMTGDSFGRTQFVTRGTLCIFTMAPSEKAARKIGEDARREVLAEGEWPEEKKWTS